MRKLWIDSLRGIAIILVVYGHCVPSWTEFFLLTSPVKMPLFFAISGYLFKSRNGDVKVFFKNLFFKLFIPWILLGLVWPYTDPYHRFISLLSGYDWFMPTLILSEIIWFFVRKVSLSAKQSCIYGLFISLFGLLLHKYTDFSYTIIYNALIVLFYIVIGYCIQLREVYIFKNWKSFLFISLFVYVSLICLTVFLYPGKSLDVHMNRYYNIPICFLLILFGCISVFIVFKKFNIGPRWLVFIGQNTFVIYMLHGYMINVLPRFCKYANIQLNTSLQVEAVFRTVSGCIICCIIALFLNRYCPFVVGKKKK